MRHRIWQPYVDALGCVKQCLMTMHRESNQTFLEKCCNNKSCHPRQVPQAAKSKNLPLERWGRHGWILLTLCCQGSRPLGWGWRVRSRWRQAAWICHRCVEPSDCCCRPHVAVAFSECLCSQTTAQGKNFPFSLIACCGDTYHPGYSNWLRGPV